MTSAIEPVTLGLIAYCLYEARYIVSRHRPAEDGSGTTRLAKLYRGWLGHSEIDIGYTQIDKTLSQIPTFISSIPSKPVETH
jgi:hypothetical protein